MKVQRYIFYYRRQAVFWESICHKTKMTVVVLRSLHPACTCTMRFFRTVAQQKSLLFIKKSVCFIIQNNWSSIRSVYVPPSSCTAYIKLNVWLAALRGTMPGTWADQVSKCNKVLLCDYCIINKFIRTGYKRGIGFSIFLMSNDSFSSMQSTQLLQRTGIWNRNTCMRQAAADYV